jgi:Flp pilus assembly protein TadG
MSTIGTVEPRLAAPATSLAALRQRFATEQNGSTAITFALAFVPCMAMVGLAIDYGRLTVTTHQTQAAFDAAALSGARAYQQTPENGNPMDKAIEASKNYWNATFKDPTSGTPPAGTIQSARYAIPSGTAVGQPYLSSSGADITFTMTQWVRTPFMSVLEAFDGGILLASKKTDADLIASGAPAGCQTSRWACKKIGLSSTIKMKASGASDGETLEISVMLDITGSMEWEPAGGFVGADDARSKIKMLKKAATSFVNIILPEADTTGKNRIALVPFGGGIYVGDEVATAVTTAPPASCTRNVAGCKDFVFTKTNDKNKNTTYYRTQNCVTVRTGDDAYTDASYTTTAVPALYDDSKFGTGSGTRTGWGQCPAFDPEKPNKNKIMPLSGNPTELKDSIENLGKFSGTAGQIGTAWAWYMLSPNWKNLWQPTNQPSAYGPTVKKVAVLMTDGEYNTQFCKGVNTSTRLSKSESNREGECTTLASKGHAATLCTNMKLAGITVYTVAFDVGENEQEMLRNCATTHSHAYVASNEDTLVSAFEDIALRSAVVLVSK